MNPVYIIAEAGVNHNGSIEIAKKLIDEAKKAGADAVKFQTFKAEKLVSSSASKADYQKKNTSSEESQLEMLKKLELSDEDHRVLLQYCKDKKIEFLSSPFDEESAEFLIGLGLKTLKIPSGEITNIPFLKYLSDKKIKILLSTGMSDLSEVSEAVAVLKNSDLTLLHCVTEYPAPYNEINLNAIKTLKNKFGLPVGYSDHSPGIEIAIASAALGAEVIEKHFTLDRTMEGPDHIASLEPYALRAMIDGIRNVEKAMGDGIKRPAVSEIKNISIARKSIVAKTDLKKGDTISIDSINIKRPGSGIAPKELDNIIGMKLNRDINADCVILKEDLT